MRCKNVREIVEEADRILFEECDVLEDSNAEYFFRGESMNFERKNEGTDCALGTSFCSFLDREENWIKNERKLYEEALRLNVISFEKDQTMVERLVRMQHFQLPTRFCDMSTNVLCAALFACGCGDLWNKDCRNNGYDGYIRVIKAKRDRIKSFTSDIIKAIASLPLVDSKNIYPESGGKDGIGYLSFEVGAQRPGFENADELAKELQHVWAFKPILNSTRIRCQSGVMLAFGCGDGKRRLNATFSPADYDHVDAATYGIAQVGVIQIDAGCKERICEELRYFGMPVEGLYADLSNVCSAIAERAKRKGVI